MVKNVFNNSAFTLLEALMSMFVMVFLSVTLLQWMSVINESYDDFKGQKQVIVMENYIQNDFIGIKDYQIINNKLELTDYNNKKISYELKDGKVIRKKNNKGYEVLLTEVKDINFSYNQRNHTISMEVKFENDQSIKSILSAITN